MVLAYVVALLAAIVELPGHSNCERELGDGDRYGDERGAVSDEVEGETMAIGGGATTGHQGLDEPALRLP